MFRITTFLSCPDWVLFCRISWIAPDNINLAAIAGTQSGLGLNPLPTFDWNVITAAQQPLISPFLVTLNSFLGTAFTFPIIVAIWYTNTWYTGYMPINMNYPYDRFGHRYKVTKVLDVNGFYDQAAYEAYSPLYLTASNAFLYGVFFAVYPAAIVYAYLHHRFDIVRGFRSLFKQTNPKVAYRDVHNRLMSVYPEVPEWWYMLLLFAAIGLGLIAILNYPTHTTAGALFMGIALAIVFIVPIGVIYAVTNTSIALNVLSEFIGGLLFPGNALAMNMLKSYGYVTTTRAIEFAQDLKLGHYSKIPPRIMSLDRPLRL